MSIQVEADLLDSTASSSDAADVQSISSSSSENCNAVAGVNAFGVSFRNYGTSERQDVVRKTYHNTHTYQTVDLVRRQHEEWLKFDKGEFTIMEMTAILDNLVDDSDPDTDLPDSLHDLQTAERIRAQWLEHDWFHLVDLLHDIGKVLVCTEVAGKRVVEQWACIGGTFPVGCASSDDCVSGEAKRGATLRRSWKNSVPRR